MVGFGGDEEGQGDEHDAEAELEQVVDIAVLYFYGVLEEGDDKDHEYHLAQ